MNIKKLFDYSQPLVAATTLFIVALCAIVLYTTWVVYDISLSRDTVAVTGSAKEAVVADFGRLVINFETKTDLTDQTAGTERMAAAVDKALSYLKEEGLTEYETPAGTVNADFFYPQNSPPVQTGFTIVRSVTVRSSKLEKLTVLANNMSPLSGAGYTVASGGLELTYSQLDDMRVKLLSRAIRDATDRANAIAAESGRTVGLLRAATGGVVQVLPLGGVEISDYGTYDTVSLNKEVMVTVRATFALE
ncbi:SIMPL domain-containing protein [Patescibacteria group bacterium]|nr:SIMPL domain-containing protein [Patescibacteria group bacterium]